jgi:hypothetical protein
MIKTDNSVTLEFTSLAEDINELKLMYFHDNLAQHRIIGEQNNVGEEVIVYLIYPNVDAYKLRGIKTEKGLELTEDEYLNIIGEIEDGLIIKGNSGEGFAYKNYVAFELKEGICYVPEHTDNENIKVASAIEEGAYTYQDFLDLTGGNEEIAKAIFDGVTWECPETFLDQSDYLIKCVSCNWVYDEEGIENPDICPKCHIEQ